MDKQVYEIWLQQALGYGNYQIKTILELYKSAKEFYDSGEYGWRLCGCFTSKQIDKIGSTSIDDAYNIFRKCRNLNYKVFSIFDEKYPKLLKEISDPPAVIYVMGDETCFENEISIAFVGAREATPYGMNLSKNMAYRVALSGANVVSGGALGIDSAAHEGAIEAGGSTIAVLGCGINTNYLISNSFLRSKIAKSGVLISEYPPDYPAFACNFPKRNRIISGLSDATVVVEAGKKSGSLITANLANNQNRDVFVAPIDLRSPLSEGIISLINDGVKVVVDMEDLVKSYENKLKNKFPSINMKRSAFNLSHEEKPKSKENISPEVPENISENAKKVYDVLDEGAMNADLICKKSGIKIENVLSSLTELEIYGLIKNNTGKEYEKI